MDKLCFWQLLNDKDRIEIPLIQRDYIQGRQNNRTKDIAMRFVAALGNAIKKRCQDKKLYSQSFYKCVDMGDSDHGFC